MSSSSSGSCWPADPVPQRLTHHQTGSGRKRKQDQEDDGASHADGGVDATPSAGDGEPASKRARMEPRGVREAAGGGADVPVAEATALGPATGAVVANGTAVLAAPPTAAVVVDVCGRINRGGPMPAIDATTAVGAAQQKHQAKRFAKYLALENAHGVDALLCDVGEVRYTEMATEASQRGKDLEATGDDFCDNVTLFTFVTFSQTLRGAGGARNVTPALFEDLLAKLRACLRLTDVDSKGKLHLSPNFPLIGGEYRDQKIRNNVRAMVDRCPEVMDMFRMQYPKEPDHLDGLVVVRYKIPLADHPLADLLNSLDEIWDELSRHGFHRYDFDFTLEHYRIFNKDEMIAHLCERFGFHIQARGGHSFPVVCDNDKAVGRDCLTILFEIDGVVVRYKMYNKWACQLQDGKASGMGNYISHIFDPYGEHMTAAFNNPKLRNLGYTRGEGTMLCTGGEKPTLAFFHKVHAYVRSLFAGMAYEVSFGAHWRAVTRSLTSSLVIFFEGEGLICVAFFGNLLTRNVTGMEIELKKRAREAPERALAAALSFFSYEGLPCHLVRVTHGAEDRPSEYRLALETYMKPVGPTIFTQARAPCRQPSEASGLRGVTGEDLARTLEERGFPAGEFVTPSVHQGRVTLTDAVITHPAHRVPTSPDLAISTRTLKERDEWVVRQRFADKMERQRALMRAEVTRVQEELRQLKAAAVEAAKVEAVRAANGAAVVALFRGQYVSLAKRFAREGAAYAVSVSAIRVLPCTNRHTKATYTTYVAFDEVTQTAYYCPSGGELQRCIEQECAEKLSVWPRVANAPTDAKRVYFHRGPGEVFLTFRVVGKYTTPAGNGEAIIENIGSTVFDYRAAAPTDAQVAIECEIERMHRVYPVTNDHLPAVHNRPDKIVFKDCTKLDDLEPNTVYTVVAMSQVVHRGQDRYVMRLTKQATIEGAEVPDQGATMAGAAAAAPAPAAATAATTTPSPPGEGARGSDAADRVPIDGLVFSNVKFEEAYRRVGAMNRPFEMQTVTMVYDKTRRGRVMDAIIFA